MIKFACPKCPFQGNGPASLGAHYRHNPTHRTKPVRSRVGDGERPYDAFSQLKRLRDKFDVYIAKHTKTVEVTQAEIGRLKNAQRAIDAVIGQPTSTLTSEIVPQIEVA